MDTNRYGRNQAASSGNPLLSPTPFATVEQIVFNDLEDVLENEERAGLEALAIPKCKSNREKLGQPYCQSAHCGRCAGMRSLDGINPLEPNAWMSPVTDHLQLDIYHPSMHPEAVQEFVRCALVDLFGDNNSTVDVILFETIGETHDNDATR